MSRGENIFKRKDGRWEARYIKRYDSFGKAKYGFCYGRTYKEAKEKVTKAKGMIACKIPEPTISRKNCLEFYCDEWLESRKTDVRESTYVKYQAVLNKYIKPYFGHYDPLNLDKILVDHFKNDLILEKGLSNKTVQDILVILKSIFKYTASFFPGEFPALDIGFLKCEKKDARVLSCAEQNKLIEYLLEDMDDCKFAILLALFTGMRIGELCALRWKNISIPDRTVHITATMQRLRDVNGNGETHTHLVTGVPKSRTSMRIIPLTDDAVGLCGRMQPKSPAAFVLTGTQKCMEPRTLQYRLKKYTKACGLENVHFHTLRHTFATRAVEAGFEIKSLSEILGHASTTITLDRYVHSSMELKRIEMSKLHFAGH